MLLIAGPLSKYTSEYADKGSTEYQYFSKIFLYKVRYPYEMMLPLKGYLSHYYFRASHVKFWYWYWYFQCFVQSTRFTSNLHTVFGLVLKLHFHFNYKWDSYALPRCSFIIHIPQKRDSFFAIVLMDAGTLFHAVKSYLIHKHFLQ